MFPISRRALFSRQRAAVGASCSSTSSSSFLLVVLQQQWSQSRACATTTAAPSSSSSSTPATPTETSYYDNIDPTQRAEVADVANCFRIAESNRIPLGRVIHGVSPGTKSKIFKSGKGLEGYLRQFPSAFVIEKSGNDKFLVLIDERLREDCSKIDAPAGTQIIAPPSVSKIEYLRTLAKNHAMRARGITPEQAAEMAAAKAKAEEDRIELKSAVIKEDSPDDPWSQAAADAAAAAAAANPDATPESKSEEKREQQQIGDEQPVDDSQQQQAGQQQQQQKREDAGDRNPELTLRVKACIPGENQWYRIATVHTALYRGTTVQIGPFVQFLLNAPRHFWVDADAGFVCRRLPYHTVPPPNMARLRDKTALAAKERRAKEREERLAHHASKREARSNNNNNSGGAPHEWGESKNAPTTQDVFEILRYIPIHWTEFGTLQIPDAARKKHIRISSKLTWFARQPRFFDLRWIGGTCEIRRAPVLHPTEHGLTKEEAERLVQARIEEDARYGQPLVLLQARGMPVSHAASIADTQRAPPRQVQKPAAVTAGGEEAAAAAGADAEDGDDDAAASAAASMPAVAEGNTPPAPASKPAASAATAATQSPSQPASSSTMSATAAAGSVSSANVEAVQKALLRIAPGYFVTADAVMRRATKKMTDDDLLLASERIPLMVERLLVRSKTNPSHTLSLYRRKLGVDDTLWKPAFIEELENSPNLALLGTLMTHLCAQWDRTHFLYVRLPDQAKIATGGFDEMVAFLRQHPQAFRTGEFFVKRNDLSDPASADADPEPTSKMVTTTRILEDNPYHQLIDVANVFHYLTPENDSVSLSHFVDSASPAIRSVLPPRILTILQAYPEKFTCREVAPGSFAVSRASNKSADAAAAEQDAALSNMTKEEAVEKVIAIIPPRGVDIAHLEATMPQQLRRAVVRLFGAGGVASLVNENAGRFHLVRNPPYTTIFNRRT